MAITQAMSVEEFLALGAEAERYELIEGVLRETEAMGGRHGEAQIQFLGPLIPHVIGGRLGRLYPEGTHFVILRDPNVIVKPDIAFVRADRLPPEDERIGPLFLVPDLVVEVVSPNDRYNDVLEKVDLYARAGVPLLWLALPRRRTVTVYLQGKEHATLGEGDFLDGGEVLPGFRMAVADVFR